MATTFGEAPFDRAQGRQDRLFDGAQDGRRGVDEEPHIGTDGSEIVRDERLV